jgi:hypothetical protein
MGKAKHPTAIDAKSAPPRAVFGADGKWKYTRKDGTPY